MGMAPSKFQSYTLPLLGATGFSPTPVASAGGAPTRVLVRNFSNVAAYLGLDVNDLKDATSSAVFRIPARSADVFLLAPHQTIYAMGEGAGSQISVAVSEAFPVVIREG